jgi:hypothetical protein
MIYLNLGRSLTSATRSLLGLAAALRGGEFEMPGNIEYKGGA